MSNIRKRLHASPVLRRYPLAVLARTANQIQDPPQISAYDIGIKGAHFVPAGVFDSIAEEPRRSRV